MHVPELITSRVNACSWGSYKGGLMHVPEIATRVNACS